MSSRVVSLSVAVMRSDLGRCRLWMCVFVWLTFRICICMLDVLWVLELSVDGWGELHYSFP